MDFWQHARHLSTFNFIWRRIMKIKAISSAVLAALSLVALPAVAASNSLTYQGVTFETTDLGFGTLELTMTGANAATGNWSGVTLLQAFEIKNIGTVTSANIIDPPGSFAANLTKGLAANGLGCNTGGGGGACFSGSPIALTSSMSWKILFTGTGLNFSVPHLKVQFLTAATDTKPTGNLLSQNIPPVPEPETYAMMLAGMGLVGAIARRRRAEQGNG